MSKYRIITEGEHETYFLVFFIQKYYGFTLYNEDQIIQGKHYYLKNKNGIVEIQALTDLNLDGLDSKLSQIKNLIPLIKTWENKGEIVSFILDAEEKSNKKGLKKRQEQLENFKSNDNLDFSYYIFPNNEEENGSFDDFLWSIINIEDFVEAKTCIDDYITCLKSTDKYKILDKKGRINAYLNLIDEKQQHKNRDYNNKAWIFDFKNNPYLTQLQKFLDKYLNLKDK